MMASGQDANPRRLDDDQHLREFVEEMARSNSELYGLLQRLPTAIELLPDPPRITLGILRRLVAPKGAFVGLIYAPGLVVLVGWLVGFFTIGDIGTQAFYTAASEVITTLLLALAVSVAWFRVRAFPNPARLLPDVGDKEELKRVLNTAAHRLGGLEGKQLLDGLVAVFLSLYDPWWRATLRWVSRIVCAVGVVSALVAGQIFALLALAHDPPKAEYARPVFAAVTGGLLGVGIAALIGTQAGRPWRPGPDWQVAVAWWRVLSRLSQADTNNAAPTSPAGQAPRE